MGSKSEKPDTLGGGVNESREWNCLCIASSQNSDNEGENKLELEVDIELKKVGFVFALFCF